MARALGRRHRGPLRRTTARRASENHGNVPRALARHSASTPPRSLGLPFSLFSLWTGLRLGDYMAEETGIRMSPA